MPPATASTGESSRQLEPVPNTDSATGLLRADADTQPPDALDLEPGSQNERSEVYETIRGLLCERVM